jgi:hypothetical protein
MKPDQLEDIKAATTALNSDDLSQIREQLSLVPKEEQELFFKLLETNDEKAFEEGLARLYKVNGKPSDNSNAEASTVEKQQKSLEQLNISSKGVSELVLYHFDLQSKQLQREAFNLEKTLLGEEVPSIPVQKARTHAKSNNPYVRLMIASHGLFPEILKEDPVSMVRLEVLKKTGKYSEHYREKERDHSVIKELIRQGIDRDYYLKLSLETQYMVESQEEADGLIEEIENGSYSAMEKVLKSISGDKAMEAKYQAGILHMQVTCDNVRPPLNKIDKSEAIKKKEKDIQDKTVLNDIKVGDETPLGTVIEIKASEIVVQDFNGLAVSCEPNELFDFVSQKSMR